MWEWLSRNRNKEVKKKNRETNFWVKVRKGKKEYDSLNYNKAGMHQCLSSCLENSASFSP